MKRRTVLAGMLALFSIVFVLAAFSCGGDSGTASPGGDNGQDAGKPDASHDAGSDGGKPDAGRPDSGIDAGADVGTDGGVPDTDIPADAGTDTGQPDSGTDGGSKDGGGCAPNCPTSEMVTVPAGSFQMGCNVAVDNECFSNEYPYHAVSVPAFKIDKYELTVGEYQACVDAGGCTAASTGGSCNYGVSGRDSHPINCVDWNQAKAYCAWAGKRLPTEAEWEKAARGTDGRKYPWGNDSLDCDHAVHSANGCSNDSTAPEGSKPAGVSPYGAEDMVGNVWEWVEDDYHSHYTGAPADGSAWVDNPRGTHRVFRGGGWNNSNTKNLRTSLRSGSAGPTGLTINSGFRCSRDGI